MTVQKAPEFGKLRSFFWPIYTAELKKVLPMFLMFFFISLVYTILRNSKDALLVTAPGSGAEAIPFLKVGGVMPAAIIAMIFYAKLSNVLTKEKLFYVTILPFVAFFILFALFLYPNKDTLHLSTMADTLQTSLPLGLHGFVATLRNWTYSLFYIMAELWGSMVLSLLFWGFANDITRVAEAKRFYALFSLGANLGLMVGGPLLVMIVKKNNSISIDGTDPFQNVINYIVAIVAFSGVMIMLLYYWINKNVLTDPLYYDGAGAKAPQKNKPKMSLGESFGFLARSKYILCIAVLVLAYNVSINLIEVTWKSQVKLQYPLQHDYLQFMGTYSTYLSITTILMLLFVSGNVMRRFGWGVAALITPVVLLISGTGFFSFVIFKEQFAPLLLTYGTTPVAIAVLFGTIQNIISKAAKYSLFDPTKEMAYIPLDAESKVKGKAAIDVVGARLGKAGGAGVQLFLISTFGSIAAVTPHIGVILFVIIAAWIWSVNSLNKEFKKNQVSI